MRISTEAPVSTSDRAFPAVSGPVENDESNGEDDDGSGSDDGSEGERAIALADDSDDDE